MNVFLGMIYSTETLREETKDTELIPCIVIHQNNSSKKKSEWRQEKKMVHLPCPDFKTFF